MADNNDPNDTVMASVHCGDGPMSFVAEAPLTVISLTGYNNAATAAFAIAVDIGLVESPFQHTCLKHLQDCVVNGN